MFRTITARYPGTCPRCNGAIRAGETIRYGGRGRTYHLAAECPSGRIGQAIDTATAARGEDAHLDDDSAEAVAMRYSYEFVNGLGR